jgi:hypothetical protein
MSTRSILRTLALLCALGPAATASNLTVGPAGSGAQFTEIQTAVDAALAGDTILVLSGTYARFVVEKPVRILGAGPGVVRVQGTSFAAQVRNIGFGQELVLSGLNLRATGSVLPVLEVEDSPGTVVLNDLVLPVAEVARPGLAIENCARVFVLESVVRGGILGGFARTQGGAVRASISQVWIANSEIEGTDGDPSVTQQGAHGLELDACEVHVWKTRIRGGGSGNTLMGSTGDGGSGIRAVTSRLDLLGGPDSEIRGGDGAHEATTNLNYAGGPGVELIGSLARIQAALPISGGFDGRRLVQTTAVEALGTSTVTLESRLFPTLSAAPQKVALGTSFTLTLAGTPNALQFPLLSFRTGPTLVLRRVEGFGMLPSSPLFKLPAVVLPANGAFSTGVGVPTSLSLLGRTLYLQSVERSPAGYAFSNPGLVAITY